MTLTEKLRLELIVREHIDKHGDEFYDTLAVILSKLSKEVKEEPIGRFRRVV